MINRIKAAFGFKKDSNQDSPHKDSNNPQNQQDKQNSAKDGNDFAKKTTQILASRKICLTFQILLQRKGLRKIIFFNIPNGFNRHTSRSQSRKIRNRAFDNLCADKMCVIFV